MASALGSALAILVLNVRAGQPRIDAAYEQRSVAVSSNLLRMADIKGC
jgi:hypothetical protein